MSRSETGRIDEVDDTIAFDDELLATMRRYRADERARPGPAAGNDPIERRDGHVPRSRPAPRHSIRSPAADALVVDAFIELPPSADRLGERPSPPAEPVRQARRSKRTDQHKVPKIRGNRGVDTLLRNGYRAQLDMLALAATKANIMISLNGLLMSLLVLSGTHFLSVDPLFIIPIGLFFLGCATATVFAVLAARPDVSRRTFQPDDFERDEARLLVFEEFSDLEEAQYVDAMSRMLRSPSRVYRNMVAHLHEMGSTADRKYQRLYYSYTLFMIGFVLAALALVVVLGMAWLRPLA